MEKSFDFGRLVKYHEKKHKLKPVQFVSVEGGVKKRLTNNLKHRKSARLTVFDNIRNLVDCNSPCPATDVYSKVEHRRLQLEKWKAEKEKKKKEVAANKKKPFVIGVAHNPQKYVPPPPIVKPSTSGMVTRSQKARQTASQAKQIKTVSSFAPPNSKFQPPKFSFQFKEKPMLAPVNKNKKTAINYSFNPVLPPIKPTIPKPTNSKTVMKTTFTRNATKTFNTFPKRKVVKNPSPKPIKFNTLQSSSSSEIDSSKHSTLQSSTEIDITSSTNKSLQSSSSTEVKMVISSSSEDASPVLKQKNSRKSIAVFTKTVPSSSSEDSSPVMKPKTPRKSITVPLNTSPRKSLTPKSESKSEDKLRSPKNLDVLSTPEQLMSPPCITMSRGKENARKEMKQKMEEGLLDEDASHSESVNHFRRQLDSEIKRITIMCEVWEKFQAETQLPEIAEELCLGAVGQARLLMRKKFQQFASLIDRCDQRETTSAIVTPADLAGFWDMLYIQIENIDLRFKKLEDMRSRNWSEVPLENSKKPSHRNPAVSKNNSNKNKPAATSRLKDMIAAARRAKKEQENPCTILLTKETATEESKSFDAGFFSVRSPVRSPAMAALTAVSTPSHKSSLLQAVLSSEAKKSASKSRTPFAMLRASILSKMEHDGIELLPQTPINLDATPARSILKSAVVASEKKPPKKSIKVVLFDDGDNSVHINGSPNINDEMESVENKFSELNTNSDILIKVTEHKENQGSARRRPKLVKQDNFDAISSVMTRSRRKSTMNTPKCYCEEIPAEQTPQRRSSKKKVLQESSDNIGIETTPALTTPKRSVRSRKKNLVG